MSVCVCVVFLDILGSKDQKYSIITYCHTVDQRQKTSFRSHMSSFKKLTFYFKKLVFLQKLQR